MSVLDSTTLRIPAPRPPRRGVFVSFEGGDGAGKSTQMAMLREHLIHERQVSEDLVLTTREPGGTPLGEQIRSLLLHGEHVDERAEALLYAADRAHHIATVVRPHLARGGLVLGDRYLDSSIAYQGAGRDLRAAEVARLSAWATGELVPDLTVLLDVTPETGRARRHDRAEDRMETEAAEFHARVRAGFLGLAQAEPSRYLVLDAAEPPEALAEAVATRVARLLDDATNGEGGDRG